MNEEGLWIDVLIDLCVNICSSISIVVSRNEGVGGNKTIIMRYES